MPDTGVDIWLYQVRAFMNTNNLKEALLPSAPATPIDGNISPTTPIEAQVTVAKSAIIAALPEETIKKLGSGIVYLNPAAILEKDLDAHQKKSTPEYRELLRQRAANMTIKNNESIADYVSRHEELRHEMARAKVEEISDEYTTVRYIIRGLRNSGIYKPHVTALLTQCALTPDLQKISKYKEIIEMHEQEIPASRPVESRNRGRGAGNRSTSDSLRKPYWCGHHEDCVFHLEKDCFLGKKNEKSTAGKHKPASGSAPAKKKGKANKAVDTDSDSSTSRPLPKGFRMARDSTPRATNGFYSH